MPEWGKRERLDTSCFEYGRMGTFLEARKGKDVGFPLEPSEREAALPKPRF